MNIFKYPRARLVLGIVSSIAFVASLQAQTAYFTNSVGGDWNTAANWDLDFTGANVVPAVATNASITTVGAVTVDYNAPMAATSFGSLAVDGGAILNINAAGFTQDLGGAGTAPLTLGSGVVNVGAAGVWTATNGGTTVINLGGDLNVAGNAYLSPVALTAPLTINANGRVDVTTGGTLTLADGGVNTVSGALSVTDGSLVISNSQSLTISPGGLVTVTNGTILQTASPSGSVALGVNNNNVVTLFQMEGGTVTFDRVLDIRGRKSGFIMNGGTLNANGGTWLREANTDDINRLVVNGGTANLGAFELHRTTSAGGLIVSNGVVNATSMRIGLGASLCYATVYAGALTNTGVFTICDRTNGAIASDRRPRFLIRGGTVVSTHAAGVVVANQANLVVGGGPAASLAGILDINAGTLISEGITLVKDNTLTNAHAVMNLSGSGAIYLGSVGLNGNVGPINSSYSIAMSGGTLAAKANYNINANITLTGASAKFQAADSVGSPFNITANGIVSSSGTMTKTGGGTLTLNATNTYSGVTLVNAGTLALGVNGSISNTPSITLESGSTLDVSAVAGGYVLNASRALFGFGGVSGNLTAASASTINPGTNSAPGTLTFANSLTQSGGALNHFDLPTTPGPGNDKIVVGGDLNVSGLNTLEIVGGGSPGSLHKLFQYGGAFNGTLANFTVSGASGTLTNDTVNKTIGLLIATAVRNPTNVVWVGNVSVNNWDTLNVTNWSNAGALDSFVASDNALFDATGIANPIVNIVGNVAPTTATIGAAGNYTFSGAGSISGSGSLTKTNTGTLTITSTNSYTGVTTISGGVLAASTLANGAANSAIGAASSAAANLVLDGGTLRYTGDTAGTDRGATINAAGGAIDIANGATALSASGNITGAGALIKSGAGNLTLASANTYTGGTIISNGTLQLNIAGAAGAAGVTNYGATVRGPSGATVTIVNEMNVNGNTTIDAANSSGDLHLTGAWSGNGTINVINFGNAGRTLTLGGGGNGGGSMANFTGTINMGTNSGHLRFNDGGGNQNLGNPAMTIDMGTAVADFTVRNGGITVEFGAFSGGSGTFLTGRASGASGTVTYSIGALNVPSTFAGTIRNGNNPAALTKVGTDKLTLTGTNTYTGLTVVNSGTLQVDGALSGTPSVTMFGGTLSGSGSISGTVDVQFGSILSPGASIGQMTMTGSLTLQSGSTNIMEINKTLGTNDAVIGLASVSYSGTLVVNNLAGTLAEFDSFKLFGSASYSGAYESIELPALGANLLWDTSKLAVDGTIRVIRLRPAITEFGVDGSNFFLTGTNGGNASTHFIIVTTTNVTTPFASWTPVLTNTFDGSGNFAFTNAVNTAEPTRFYNVKTP